MYSDSFLKDYALMYDDLYKKKDYKKEVDFLIRMFPKDTKYVLDIACGTGKHCKILSDLGYKVTGQDKSEAMLKLAKKRCKKGNFKQVDMRTFKSEPIYDAAICMFSSIDYVINHIDVIRTFMNVYDSLRPGGIFVFDFWNKPCVEKHFEKFRKTPQRYSITDLDTENNIATINMYFKDKVETHKLRYHLLEDMTLMLQSADFHNPMMFPFMEPGKKITDKIWNISVVVRK